MHVSSARFLSAATDARHLPRHPWPEIAFAGRSNVGKSSLLNRLVGHQRLARVSKTPGRTQQLNFFVLDERLVFVDLPGYGFAKVPLAVKERWKDLVEGYLVGRKPLRGVVLLVDARRGTQDDDRMLLDFLRAEAVPVLLVLTKIDKLKRSEQQRVVAEIARQPLPGARAVVPTAATTGEGMRELWREIEALVDGRG